MSVFINQDDMGVGVVQNVTVGKWYIENTFNDKNEWHLTNSKEEEGSYFMPIKNASDIIKVLEHFGDKEWVDREKLLNALMPAIRYFSYKQ